MNVICPHCHNDVVIVLTTKECTSVEIASDSVQISVSGQINARSNGDNARSNTLEGGKGGVPDPVLSLLPSDPSQQSGSGARARRGRKDATDYPLGFLALWALAKAQGKAGNKFPAFKSYLKLNADAELNALILTRFEEWTRTDQWRRGFNQHLATWLNQRGWEEAPTAADLAGPSNRPPGRKWERHTRALHRHPRRLRKHPRQRETMTPPLRKPQVIAASVTMLSETFRQPLTDAGARGYTLGLEELTTDEIGFACKRALRECRFMPSPAELIALAGRGGAKAMTARTAEAWEAVRTAMDRHDYTTNVDFGPLVNAVIRNLGGWVAMCARSVPDLVWVRKDFERLFEAFAEKPPETLHGEYLAGAFQGPVVAIAIGGVMPQRQLEAAGVPSKGEIRSLVRELGDAKS